MYQLYLLWLKDWGSTVQVLNCYAILTPTIIRKRTVPGTIPKLSQSCGVYSPGPEHSISQLCGQLPSRIHGRFQSLSGHRLPRIRMRTTIGLGTPNVSIVMPSNLMRGIRKMFAGSIRLISRSWPSSSRMAPVNTIVPAEVSTMIGKMFPLSECPIPWSFCLLSNKMYALFQHLSGHQLM